MAIRPPSDIVLDVARAADPERYRVAAERLSRLRATAAAAAGEASAPPTEFRPAANRPLDAGSPGRDRRQLDAYGQFEAFVLQSFLQAMLPRNASNVYGRGTAGEVWRSMLAEQLGGQLARSGQVGIARRLAAGAPQPEPDASSASVPPALSAAQLSALSSIPPPTGSDASTAAPPPQPVRS